MLVRYFFKNSNKPGGLPVACNKNQLSREASTTILPVVAGGLMYVTSAFLFFSLGLFIWADGGSKEEIQRIETNAAISIPLAIVIGRIVAGLVTTLLSKAENVIYAASCGTVLFLM